MIVLGQHNELNNQAVQNRCFFLIYERLLVEKYLTMMKIRHIYKKIE